jgi:iron only hydrogenase large subunit-like protein
MLKPIHTEATECQDCYKCVRGCPVKAIRIENGSAQVMYEHCLFCGHCVQVCPVGAKRVRFDTIRAKQLLNLRQEVWFSLAPSWVSEFPNVSERQMVAAIRRLGFSGVSETALGAEIVSRAAATMMEEERERRIFISTACPAIVNLIEKFHPHLVPALTALASPVITHARLLRQIYGREIGVVFASPCVAKKSEADAQSATLDLALTFRELADWFERENIDPGNLIPEDADHFAPQRATNGRLYPVDGGMLAGIRAGTNVTDAAMMSFSGINEIREVLTGLDTLPGRQPLFLELLACEGGCINGPQGVLPGALARKRLTAILAARSGGTDSGPTTPYAYEQEPDVSLDFSAQAPDERTITDDELRVAMRSIGKYVTKDELNCSGCGYDCCRDFARALVLGKAERDMCVSWMRKLAQKKANALIRTMPSGIVIVNEDLRIVECNARFASIMGKDIEELFEAKPGLEGASLEKIVPFHKIFSSVLEIGEDIQDRDIRYNNSILHVSIFSINGTALWVRFWQT